MSQDSRGVSQALTPHPRPLRWLHWFTVAAVVLVFALAWGREAFEPEDLQHLLLNAHRWIGLTIWTATLLRVLVKLRAWLGSPAHKVAGRGVSDMPLPLRLASAGAHGVMYLCLLGLPLLGWALTSAQGHALTIGAFHLPMLLPADPDLADTLEDVHGYLGDALAALVALHLCAVAWHHRWRHDDVLGLMWPAVLRKPAR
jgi:cytochrome b561